MATSRLEAGLGFGSAIQPVWPAEPITAVIGVRAQRRRGKQGRRAAGSWLPFGLSAGIDLLAFAAIALGNGRLPSYLAAAGVHLLAVLVATRRHKGLLGARRVLAGSLVLALPFTGIALAVLALATRPRAGLADAILPDSIEPPALGAAGFHKIAEALSPCEELSMPGNPAGGATLAALIRRGDAASVGLLRWLVNASTEMSVPAAMALEELSMRFDDGLASRRLALLRAPSAASALEAGIFIARAMQSGLIDPVMLAVRAAEARLCFSLAKKLAPARAEEEVMLAWGQMEVAAMRPDAALLIAEKLLARPAPGRARLALSELREQALVTLHGRVGRDLGAAPGDGTWAVPARLAA
jgi:hypothetical protein